MYGQLCSINLTKNTHSQTQIHRHTHTHTHAYTYKPLAVSAEKVFTACIFSISFYEYSKSFPHQGQVSSVPSSSPSTCVSACVCDCCYDIWAGHSTHTHTHTQGRDYLLSKSMQYVHLYNAFHVIYFMFLVGFSTFFFPVCPQLLHIYILQGVSFEYRMG